MRTVCSGPLLHYRTDLIDYDPKDEDGYKRVNHRFATRLAAMIEPDDLIWVQDYHYLTFAQQLRMAEVNNRIGFFSAHSVSAARCFQRTAWRRRDAAGVARL